MALSKIDPTQLEVWQELKRHFNDIASEDMNNWFNANPNRSNKFHIRWNNFYVDYSKNRITPKTQNLLLKLAEKVDLKRAIKQQFEGDTINETENRAVLHTALRSKHKPEEVKKTLQRMKSFSEAVISGKWKGYTGKPITTIVNIGIGGSDLGPKMTVDALKYYHNHLNVHFVSNVDGDAVIELQKQLDPETTLFFVASKSFSTQETLTNAHIFRKWFLKSASEKEISKHFVAITSNTKKAMRFGVLEDYIFPIQNWVGGRFSMWSAVGLSIVCAIGFTHYEALLNGAQKMDSHFKTADFDKNIPVILGLLSIWYNNFFDTETEAIIPYSNYLNCLVPFLEQSFMESNGKSVSRNGEQINYQTGNIIWGAVGTNAQHAFFQLLHQGTKLVPCDFIGFKHPLHGNQESHQKLMANFFAQTEALLKGKSKKEVLAELSHLDKKTQEQLLPFKTFEGNKPTTTILINQLTPENLGSLIALYEHKIFVEGVVWNIFSYDQYGVELGKQLASHILNIFESDKNLDTLDTFDNSTMNLLEEFLSED